MKFDDVPQSKVPVPPHPREDIFNAVIRDRGSTLITPNEVQEHIGERVEEGKSILLLNARQGGGNDECWCETGTDEHESYCLWKSNRDLESLPGFMVMEYDPFDPTYNYFYFKLDMDEETYDAQEQARYDALETNRLVEERNFILAHDLPHSLLGKNPKNKFNEYQRLKQKIRQENEEAEEAEKSVEEIRQTKKRILDDMGTDTDFSQVTNVRQIQDHIKSKVKEYHKRVADNANAQKVEDEINNLPDGSALKEVLLRDRGTFTYVAERVPPGKRRAVKRNVTAKRPTEAESLLKGMVTRESLLESIMNQILRDLDPLNKKIDVLSRVVRRNKENKEKLIKLRKELGFEN